MKQLLGEHQERPLNCGCLGRDPSPARMPGAQPVFRARDFPAARSSNRRASPPKMNRLLAISLAALISGTAAAQTQPQPQTPARPKPGTIVPRPDSGRIVAEPTPATPTTGPATG